MGEGGEEEGERKDLKDLTFMAAEKDLENLAECQCSDTFLSLHTPSNTGSERSELHHSCINSICQTPREEGSTTKHAVFMPAIGLF